MRKLTTYLAPILLLFASQIVVAQHSGHGMGGGMGAGGNSHDNSAMKDMQRMIAVQASDEQKVQFRSWTQSTEALKQEMQDLERANGSEDYANKIAVLKAKVDESKNGKEQFERSLSSTQHAGLKKHIQHVNKANDQLIKAVSDALHEFDRSQGTKKALKLGKAVQAANKLFAEQKKLGTEMSI